MKQTNKKTKSIILTCKSVWYYSTKDEDAFFEWIKKIPYIEFCNGRLDELYLHCKEEVIEEDDLLELLALFYRYKVDMKQLNQFLNQSNKEWFFQDKKTFWHKKVFGKKPSK